MALAFRGIFDQGRQRMFTPLILAALAESERRADVRPEHSFLAVDDLARRGSRERPDDRQQRRFPRAVRPEDHRHLARLEGRAHPDEGPNGAVRLRDRAELDAGLRRQRLAHSRRITEVGLAENMCAAPEAMAVGNP